MKRQTDNTLSQDLEATTETKKKPIFPIKTLD